MIMDLLINCTLQETKSSFTTKILFKLNNACFAALLQSELKIINNYSLKKKVLKIQLGKAKG